MKLFNVSYYFTNDGYDSAFGTPFHTYTACTQILVLEEAHEFIPYRLVRTNNIHKGKAPINKESIKKIKKKHTLWTLYIETKRKY